ILKNRLAKGEISPAEFDDLRAKITRSDSNKKDDLDSALSKLVAESRSSFLFESRSEEHTSELQSQSNLVCRLLLEKKKKIIKKIETKDPAGNFVPRSKEYDCTKDEKVKVVY